MPCSNKDCFGNKLILANGTPVCVDTVEKFKILYGKRLSDSWFPIKGDGCACQARIDELNLEHENWKRTKELNSFRKQR